MYQGLYNRAKNIVKTNACMTFYDAARTLYLEADTVGIGHGAGIITGKGCHVLITCVC